jgi:hypothetical protein
MNAAQTCPRCDKRGMKAWPELTDEEREMVKRLPLSASYSLEERKTTHRWCTRCWYEATETDAKA